MQDTLLMDTEECGSANKETALEEPGVSSNSALKTNPETSKEIDINEEGKEMDTEDKKALPDDEEELPDIEETFAFGTPAKPRRTVAEMEARFNEYLEEQEKLAKVLNPPAAKKLNSANNSSVDERRQSSPIEDTLVVEKEVSFVEKEAMFNAYLEQQEKQAQIDAVNPNLAEELSSAKPRRRTKAELLKSLPGNLLSFKPVIRPSNKAEIDFDEDFKSTNDTKKKGIEDLMHRFAIHTTVHKPPKEEHYKIHITKKEKDSQGIEHIETSEADYVKIVDDEELEDDQIPIEQAPGVKMAKVKAKMLSDIRANRAKAYQEKLKVHAMYSDEKDLDGKGEGEAGDDEEILLDDDMSEESEADESGEENEKGDQDDSDDEPLDENAEEDVETLLDANPKEKKQRKRVYLEDEADESGEDRSGDEDEDAMDRANKDDMSFIDDRPISDEEDSDEEPPKEKEEEVVNSNSDLNASQGFSIDHRSQTQPEECVSQDLFSDFASQQESEKGSQLSSSQNPVHAFLDPNKTPKISAAILKHPSSPLGPWPISNYRSSSIRHPGNNISPLIPRLNSDAALAAYYEDLNEEDIPAKTSLLSVEVAKLVGQTDAPCTPVNDEDLEDICSARFPSQQPETPAESQEFDGFQFNSQENVDTISTPLLASKSNSLIQRRDVNETPKTGDKDKVQRNTRLLFNDFEPEPQDDLGGSTKEIDADDEDDDDVVGTKIQRKRKRRLHFSDDESNGDSDVESPDEASAEDSEGSEADDQEVVESKMEEDASEKEYDENEEEVIKPTFAAIRSTKTGKIRKEFVDAEAELSGSEIGSADEDERGLDEYEDEAGDADDVDEDKLRDQVGRAHLKQLLDDDQRQINYLQNVYLEDGDLHSDGKGRERKFRWKNLDDLAFEGARMEEGVSGDVIEDELEIKWRQEKIEKLKWIKENSQNFEEEEFEMTSQKLLEGSQFLKLGKTTLRKMQKTMSLTETTIVSTDKSPGTAFERKGSFLGRDNTLSRIAEMARIQEATKLGQGKGFVFAMVTPPTDAEKSKGPAKRPSIKNQPKKLIKIDRSFDNSNDPESQNSIFKWM